MPESRPRKRNSSKPGMRALNACGDGFWEFELAGGPQPEVSVMRCNCGAFAVLPIAAALLDGKGSVLQANRKWSESPAGLMPEP